MAKQHEMGILPYGQKQLNEIGCNHMYVYASSVAGICTERVSTSNGKG